MNKTYLVVGGTAAVSLAAGGTAGYFYAKKKFDATLEVLVAEEVAKTEEHFQGLLAEYRSLKEAAKDHEDDTDEDGDEEPAEPVALTEADQAVIAKGRRLLDEASAALTDYRGISSQQAKPPLASLVEKNIFTEDKAKKKLPPRDPTTKRFVKRTSDPEQTVPDKRTPGPYIISQEEFLMNDSEYSQENIRWFVNDQTLLKIFEDEQETVDIELVGAENLAQFPVVPEGEPRIICVRNEGLEMDYEILLTEESIAELLGMSNGDDFDKEDLDFDEFAGQD